jgi:hypothetical protein
MAKEAPNYEKEGNLPLLALLHQDLNTLPRDVFEKIRSKMKSLN